MNNYQLIPLQSIAGGAGAEDTAWLEGGTGCANSAISSNAYFSSPEYQKMLTSTADFYKTVAPLVNNTLAADQITFKNAYAS